MHELLRLDHGAGLAGAGGWPGGDRLRRAAAEALDRAAVQVMDTAMRREILRLAMPWLVLAGLLIVWEVACTVFDVPEILLPKPSKIFVVFVQRFGVLMAYCWDTLWTTTIGFLL